MTLAGRVNPPEERLRAATADLTHDREVTLKVTRPELVRCRRGEQ